MPVRPQNEDELQKREATGVIRASRFVRKHAHSREVITLDTILKIHTEIFTEAWPEIAGKYRIAPVEITNSKHLPPHHTEVPGLMLEMGKELEVRLKALERAEGIVSKITDTSEERFEVIFRLLQTAAWLHHKITSIHPFSDGNGRTARLAANLILERYGLVGLSIKVERENKDRYRAALAQMDLHNDDGPLLDLMVEGIVERYSGVPKKIQGARQK